MDRLQSNLMGCAKPGCRSLAGDDGLNGWCTSTSSTSSELRNLSHQLQTLNLRES